MFRRSLLINSFSKKCIPADSSCARLTSAIQKYRSVTTRSGGGGGGASDQKTLVGIVGVPFSKGQLKSGVAWGPQAVRAGGLIQEILEVNKWVDIKDYGDIEPCETEMERLVIPENMINYKDTVGTMKLVSEKVHQVLNDGRICMTIGGDHAIGLGTVDGHLKHDPNTVIFWIDAHADINTYKTSGTGNIHGMPVAMLSKELKDLWPVKMPGLNWKTSRPSARDFVYIGLRSVDPYERLIMNKYNVHSYGMREVDQHGIVECVKMAMQNVDPENKKGIHISFDIDSLDVLEAPSTGTPVRGGLSLREGIFIVEELFKTGRLKAIDLVEVNPYIGSLTDVKTTVDAAIQVLKAACGCVRSGNLPLKDEIN